MFIKIGICHGLSRNERKCILCTQNVSESEYHLRNVVLCTNNLQRNTKSLPRGQI